MSARPRNQLAVLVFSTGVLALMVLSVWLRLAIPSDGASLVGWEEEGVLVEPLTVQSGGLRSGDMVTAVAGYSMESWAQSLFESGGTVPQLKVTDTVTYSVVRDGEPLDLDITYTRTPFVPIVRSNWSGILLGFVFYIIATFVLIKGSSIPASWALYLLAASILFSTLNPDPGLRASDLAIQSGFWSFHLMTLFGFILIFPSFLYFGLVFPRPLPIVKRYRWLIPLIFAMPYVIRILYLLFTRFSTSSTLEWISGWWYGEQSFVAPVFLILTLIAIIWSYRTNTDAVSRQQVRWVVFAFLVVMVSGLAVAVLPELFFGRPLIPYQVLALPALVIPLSIAIAILRYRLFDIDLIIRRTLVYGALTILLGLVYFGSVVLLQQAFRALTGQDSPIAIVISTLVIAALFSPLRRRVQEAIDWRFYRRKYDAQQALAAFAATARDEVELEKLTTALLRVVEDSLQPEAASLWLKKNSDEY